MGTWTCLLDRYGYPIREPLFTPVLPATGADELWMSRFPSVEAAAEELRRTTEELSDKLTSLFYRPAFLAISMMNCKNVELKTERPPEKVNKKRRKNGRPELITYKTLNIDLMRKVLRDEGKSEQTGIKTALHLCRGHFKDYRSSPKGLFGKYKGLWWWGSHMAGSPEEGAVVKDYEVKKLDDPE